MSERSGLKRASGLSRRRLLSAVGAIGLAVVTSGCLGTVVQTPAARGKPVSSDRVHILAAPFVVDAHVCQRGIARTTTFVPLYGVAVGILTIGIVVPKTTTYECVE